MESVNGEKKNIMLNSDSNLELFQLIRSLSEMVITNILLVTIGI